MKKTIKKIKVKPVDKNNWIDFETLFKSKGAPKVIAGAWPGE
jgi:hypothetical protein